MKDITLIHGEALEEMDKLIEQGIKVDAVITDPPYGTTDCKWDSVIPFEPMWDRLNKLIKPNGAIVLFGSEPFSSALRMSNIKNYKYDWVWNKKLAGAFMVAKYRPLPILENVIIFGTGGRVFYYPKKTKGKMRLHKNETKRKDNEMTDNFKGLKSNFSGIKSDLYYPKNLIEIPNTNRKGRLHPTQKPVELMEYLIKTYTLPKDMVLDFCIGSGTTLVACQNQNRRGIGIELEKKYFDIATDRLNNNPLTS